jgi:hypothetical protein
MPRRCSPHRPLTLSGPLWFTSFTRPPRAEALNFDTGTRYPSAAHRVRLRRRTVLGPTIAPFAGRRRAFTREGRAPEDDVSARLRYRPMGARPRVVLVTRHRDPYMVAVLEVLAKRVDLAAPFCSRTGIRGGDWAFDGDFGFRYRVLEGPTIARSRDAADLHPNPRILASLSRERPQVVISGAWSFPSLFRRSTGGCRARRLAFRATGRRTRNAVSTTSSSWHARSWCARSRSAWATASRPSSALSSWALSSIASSAPRTRRISRPCTRWRAGGTRRGRARGI